MNGVLIAAALLTAQAATPRGDDFGIHSLVEVPNPYPGMRTFDLVLSLPPSGFFTGSTLYATVQNGQIFDHAPSSDVAPNPALFDADPMIEYDTFLTSPDVSPTTALFDPTEVSLFPFNDLGVSIDGTRLGNVYDDGDAETEAVWTAFPTTASSGVIARITIAGGSDAVLVVGGETLTSAGNNTFPFQLMIPEPDTVVLVVLLAVWQLRVRRV